MYWGVRICVMASCCSDRLNKWKKRCLTAANQLRNVCRCKHGYFRHSEVNTWTYTFFSFSQNTKKKTSLFDRNLDITAQKLVTRDRNTDLRPACVIWETAGYRTKTSLWICTLLTETCLIMVTSLTITIENAKIMLYQWKVTTESVRRNITFQSKL